VLVYAHDDGSYVFEAAFVYRQNAAEVNGRLYEISKTQELWIS
jgi:hypothetical protein